MERPPLEQAPLGWLKEVVEALVGKEDDGIVKFRIKSADDDRWYDFTYPLGEVRAELRGRTTH